MRIGIYAGTFDPIHDGHVEFAQAALKLGNLEKIIVVAEKEPYRKQPFASWDHRQAMIERATEELEDVDHNYNFANQLAKKHTLKDMLAVAKKHYGDNIETWFLVGSDIFEHFHKWEDVVDSKQYGGFLVALKNDQNEDWLKEKISNLSTQNKHIHAIVIPHSRPYASSSNIRIAIKSKQVPNNLAKNVYKYVKAHQLYQ